MDLKREKRRYDACEASVRKSRTDWTAASHRIDSILAEIEQNPKDAFFFDRLYIDGTTNAIPSFFNEYATNQNAIRLYFGNHPTGIAFTSRDAKGNIKFFEQHTEHGGQLVFSQAPRGDVFVMIYGCTSEVLKSEPEYLFYKRFRSPNDISDRNVEKAVKIFLWYNRITSVFGNITLCDFAWVRFYEIKNNLYTLDIRKLLVDCFAILGAVFAAYPIIEALYHHVFNRH